MKVPSLSSGRWIEAVPNLSEGRDRNKIDALAAAVTGSPGARLLDVHDDPSHHRCVLTAVLRPLTLVECLVELAEKAVSLIDLREHRGEHPRIGALDVVPIIPLDPKDEAAAIELSRQVGRALSERVGIPVFFYGGAVKETARRSLAELRRGGPTGLARRMARGELTPDLGPATIDPRVGATVVGARDFLIAYNVALKTTGVDVARTIARSIRASSGGLPALQALGMSLEARGLTQVSMNLLDDRVTSLKDAFDAVRVHASAAGVEVDHSEIVGLIPRRAAFDGMEEALVLNRPAGILEDRMVERGAT